MYLTFSVAGCFNFDDGGILTHSINPIHKIFEYDVIAKKRFESPRLA
jgi:hypothetical protein